MSADFLKAQLEAAQQCALAGLKSGQRIGFQEGMLRAIAICEAHALRGDDCTANDCAAIARELRAELAKARA